jgi:hypothetical protein
VFSPTISPSFTSSATDTPFYSPTETPTISPTPSESPTFSVSPTQSIPPTPQQGTELLLAPVPARLGQLVCLYPAGAQASGNWELYGSDQLRLGSYKFGPGESQCMPTLGLAPGIYYVKMHLDLSDRSTDKVQAVVVLP